MMGVAHFSYVLLAFVCATLIESSETSSDDKLFMKCVLLIILTILYYAADLQRGTLI